MKRLDLNAFKAQVKENQELEELTGGILGACHCTSSNCGENGATSLWQWFIHKYIEGGHSC